MATSYQKEAALGLIGRGCDVVLGVYADGMLLAAKEHSLPAFGVDVDRAPFHAWDGKIPGNPNAHLQGASDGLKDGSIKIDLP